jgi:hypothetical protein
LKLQAEIERGRGDGGLAGGRLKAEHCHRKLAGAVCRKSTHLKPASGVGHGGNAIRSAYGCNGRARNRLAAGTYNAILYVRGGREGENENQTR